MKKPAVIVISSHVARGSVGNRSIVFALETMGFPVWVVQTVQLPWHPGHGPSTRIVPPHSDFEMFMNDLRSSDWISEVGGILTGYMANAEQVHVVSDFVQTLKKEKPDLIHLCDPVLGDHNQLYIAEETAAAIRDHLIPICDIATPNLFEVSWIAGRQKPETPAECGELSHALPAKRWVITSCPANDENEIGNLYLDGTSGIYASHQKLENPPNGSGDLTAGLFLGHVLSGETPYDALKHTTSTTFEMLTNSVAKRSDELILAGSTETILKPGVEIKLSTIH